jgi:hypothetical protein
MTWLDQGCNERLQPTEHWSSRGLADRVTKRRDGAKRALECFILF